MRYDLPQNRVTGIAAVTVFTLNHLLLLKNTNCFSRTFIRQKSVQNVGGDKCIIMQMYSGLVGDLNTLLCNKDVRNGILRLGNFGWAKLC